MEGEANLEAPAATSSPVFVNRFSSSSSSSSSSSLSSTPGLLRHVQAAFKRHRPLVTMQSNSIRPRRILVPQREACRNSLDLPLPNTIDDVKGDLVSYTDGSVSVPGQSEIPSSVLCAPDVATALDECPDPSDGQKTMSIPVNRIPENHAVSSQGDFQDVSAVDFATDNFATEKASECMETYRDVGAPESYFYVTDQSSEQKNYGNKPESGVYSRPSNRADQHHLKNPTHSKSAAGSSSATATTLVNSSSAPAAISTTDCSLSFMDDASHGSRVPPPKYGDAISVPDLRNSAPAPARKEPKEVEGKTVKQEKGEGNRGRKKNYDTDMFFKVNGKLYQKLGKIGSGGSSEVHKVISSDCSIYALKKIKLKGRDYGTAYGFCQEIEYLNRLKGKKNIIQLIDYEVTDKALLEEVAKGATNVKENKVKDDGYIYMVLEYGEIDLAHMLSQKRKELAESDQKIDDNWLRFYWQQILLAVNTIHEERIVHSDLKPANFLLVKGSLKLIDFGIAKAIMNDTTNIQRDSQVGTLSYMSPEAFMCNERDDKGKVIKCGRASDIWSLGCILYQMVYGRTPFAEYKSFWAKFKVITDRNHRILYDPLPNPNPSLLHLMNTCLTWDSSLRWRIPDLLRHPFILPPPPPLHLLHLMLSDAPEHEPPLFDSAAFQNYYSQLLSRLSQLSLPLSVRLSRTHPDPDPDTHPDPDPDTDPYRE